MVCHDCSVIAQSYNAFRATLLHVLNRSVFQTTEILALFFIIIMKEA